MTQDAVNVSQLQEFDEIVDVRSPSEYALDHIPGAINCPVLDDEERARVGTLHAQESAFAAKRTGAALVARNIARHLETTFADKPKHWHPLIYCWRGGQRSAAMTIVLRQTGWDARRLGGGYKAYRRQVTADIDSSAERMSFRVICGLTGSGKSALLRELEKRGAQVLDLERAAEHRGSVLGNLPDSVQPGQKMFDSRIWETLRKFDPAQPVYVEAESRKIGSVRVPASLMDAMRASQCILLDTATAARVNLLLREYAHFTRDEPELFSRLDCLTWLHGKQRVERWKALASGGEWSTFVGELLESHYDPAYRKSTGSNYPGLERATRLTVANATEAEFAGVARALTACPLNEADAAFRSASVVA
jgi:tRNA 2-selenouridine synthase